MVGNNHAERLIAFFDPELQGADPRGRTLQDMIDWPDEQLELSHDYIQNLFPLPEGSMFNHAIWLIDRQAYDALRERPELLKRLREAAERIFRFYGLSTVTSDNDDVYLERGNNFPQAQRRWVSRFNHNHLRITRVLRSLRVLGLPRYADAFHLFLNRDADVNRIVSPTSLMYWRRAATRPLRLPPDEEDDNARGITWLADLEG